ncbi:phenylalanine--tRNA ligase subunit beta [Nakamurella sp. YIM 132087]|uniref:Phenylalanine--tRNA ligase beta subunit n=1 Tax=Nakamurella alba TaxID=2665158 RepID=A0A7K1FIX6_9ACTN|nr:phenylalanine--tRNA ligase subunit beta [Nakamurella alba]MTD14026.1 phenylalanine--tRNA ligase subunit beta [Nakamurella alba]
MRAPVEWLSEYVDVPAGTDAQQVADALLSVGFETEDVHVPPVTTGPLVVGRVLTIEELTGFKKPIRFCTVEVGPGNGAPDSPGGAVREIVCGARNFVEGDLVVVALPGSVLPGDFAIASRRTYDHLSDGMICSVRELGVGNDHEGIMVLDPDDPAAVIGSDPRRLIGADPVEGAVVELAVTPDRGYALSMRGLARELGIAMDVPFRDPAADPVPDREAGGWPVHIEDPHGCSRFVTVRVSGVDPAAPSPFWMRRRLLAAGIRSISLAVDVTNYVMLEFGQPLHAFDLAQLSGDIVVRRALPGEQLRTLDGAVRTLVVDDLVVADESGPISLAGVMGGESTEISAGTTEVLIEAAWWAPEVITRTARRHRLPSEASRRFERVVDPEIAAAAAEAAAALLVRFGGGAVLGRSDVGLRPAPVTITLPLGEPERLAGRPYTPEVITHRLEQIGATVTGGESALQVSPPSWRPDLTRAADLVEEIARLEGYDTIPWVLPTAPAGTGRTSRQDRVAAIAADLSSAGLTEVLSFPFIGTKDLDQLGLDAGDDRRRTAVLSNPLDADRPSLTTTLLPGLLDAVVRNISRSSRELAVFEIGQVFLPAADSPAPPRIPVDRRPDEAQLDALEAALPAQPRHLAVVLAGPADRAGWWGPARTADWSDAVELARRVVRTAGVAVTVTAGEQQPWHPGRCARIGIAGDGSVTVGFAGELHPAVCERLGLPPRTVAVELDLDAIPAAALPVGPRISPFPPVLLDLALVVDDTVPAGTVAEALVQGGGELLESVRLFDVYTGERVAAGTKSLAFALVVRAADRTMTAAEALGVRDAALAAAHTASGATLRD